MSFSDEKGKGIQNNVLRTNAKFEIENAKLWCRLCRRYINCFAKAEHINFQFCISHLNVGGFMQTVVIDMLNRFGYFGISLLIMAENLFPPIPSEAILTFGGFITTQTKLNIVAVIIYSVLGSLGGAVVLYFVGRILSAERISALLDKYGRFLRLKSQDVQKAQSKFLQKGTLSVLVCRFIPIVRSLISIPAGMAKMDFTLFCVYTVIGTAVWNAVLVCLGAAAGNNWEAILKILQKYSKTALLVLFVIFVLVSIKIFRKNKQKIHKKRIDF